MTTLYRRKHRDAIPPPALVPPARDTVESLPDLDGEPADSGTFVIDPSKAASRTHAAAVAVWRMATAAVAEVSKWCDHELTEQREALASLKEDLHADEYALSLGSAAREVA